jgi:four helix bundle protein
MKRNFMELQCWQQAHVLALDVYAAAEKLPEQEQEGLGNDICNAALSIGGTIARASAFEGAELREAFEAAIMSAREVQQLLFVMRDLGHLSAKETSRLEKQAMKVRDLVFQEVEKIRVPT